MGRAGKRFFQNIACKLSIIAFNCKTPPSKSEYLGGTMGSSIEGGSLNEEEKAKAQRTSEALFYGSIASFVSGVLLLMSYASPYWLASWRDTQSPFVNMGLWEFCFFRFRHPDYQFDHLFHGCHMLYGEEYRLIREKLLPGWLMVVQFFVTISLLSSAIGIIIIVCLYLRSPLEWILRFEWHFCRAAFVCKGLSALLLFLSICIFGGKCWDRDWLLYPNYNYVSWSYAFAVFSCMGHIVATIFLYIDCQQAKERKERNKALIMQMHPPAFSSLHGSSYHMGGSGYI